MLEEEEGRWLVFVQKGYVGGRTPGKPSRDEDMTAQQGCGVPPTPRGLALTSVIPARAAPMVSPGWSLLVSRRGSVAVAVVMRRVA